MGERRENERQNSVKRKSKEPEQEQGAKRRRRAWEDRVDRGTKCGGEIRDKEQKEEHNSVESEAEEGCRDRGRRCGN